MKTDLAKIVKFTVLGLLVISFFVFSWSPTTLKSVCAFVFLTGFLFRRRTLTSAKTYLPKINFKREGLLEMSLKRLYRDSSELSFHRLQEALQELKGNLNLPIKTTKLVEALNRLNNVRALFKSNSHYKKVAQILAYRKEGPAIAWSQSEWVNLNNQDITLNIFLVSDMYEKLTSLANSDCSFVRNEARALVFKILGKEDVEAMEFLIDRMKRNGGLSFWLFQLISMGHTEAAKKFTDQWLMSEDLEEDLRTTLYWINEIHWFCHVKESPINDFESTIKYLYHLCFTDPERTGFLEIDSPFFSEFEHVNELASEGFLYKEELFQNVLEVWKEYKGLFNPLFQTVLSDMSNEHNKIYDQPEFWDVFWEKNKNIFSKEYLFVVEGNQAYKSQNFKEAKFFYEKAIAIRPGLRSAHFNVVFAYAKLKEIEKLQNAANSLIAKKQFYPSSLKVVGNAYLLIGNKNAASVYFEELKTLDLWKNKVDYHQSLFCYENGMYEEALEFARMAQTSHPEDARISYHLSLIYSALGKVDKALDMVKKVGEGPAWMSYYRFTLERDNGLVSEAMNTLKSIPKEYFDDPEELNEAIEFAKSSQDLGLLRYLKNR